MCRKLAYLFFALGFCLTSSAATANIIRASDNKPPPGGVPADQGWVDLLVAQGCTVNLNFRNKEGHTRGATKIPVLNAPNLIIVSRDRDSGNYDDGDEPSQWNENYEADLSDRVALSNECLAVVSQNEDDKVTACDFSLLARTEREHPYPVDALTECYERAAAYIVSQLKFPRGYCFVYGASQGRLAYELRIRSSLHILGVESDSDKVDTGRAILDDLDIYGDRITLHKGLLDSLRYRDYAGMLVVSDAIIETGTCPGSAAEMFRMVRPDGGIAVIGQPPGCPNVLSRSMLQGWLDADRLDYTITEDKNGLWAHIYRGPLLGAGEWTHMWGDIANTACSGDTRITDDFKVLWYGGPGPRILTDRHWRPAAPLYKRGRMVVPGDNLIICVDAYNGAQLWSLVVPNSSRIAILRDAGWLALDEDHVYIAAGGDCLKVDFDNGQVLDAYHPPVAEKDWGYVGIDGDLLLGSIQRVGASRLAVDYYDKGQAGNQISRLDNQPTVVSEGLFCRDLNTDALLWTYDSSDGLSGNPFVIANPTICVGGDHVYFFESYAVDAVNAPDARVRPATFCSGANEYLVKLNKNTGVLVWRRQYDLPFTNIIYLSYGNNVVLASGCTTQANFWYHLRAYHTSDGSLAWEKDWDSGMGSNDKEHGKQDKHPMIVGDNVYLKFGSYNLQTGASIGFSFRTTNCADCSACATHCFSRNSGNPAIYNFARGSASSVLSPAMRPGCYVSIIPAGGIIMLPAYSAGCTCGYTLQTSIAWLPEGFHPPPPSRVAEHNRGKSRIEIEDTGGLIMKPAEVKNDTIDLSRAKIWAMAVLLSLVLFCCRTAIRTGHNYRGSRVVLSLVLFFCQNAVAEDWPTRLHDMHRSGITSESLTLPLTERWTYDTGRRPAPAWTESPAGHDYYHSYYDLKPRQNFDFAFDVAVASGFVYFGSSKSGTINCLDATTGERVWTFFTEGPVRFSPTVANGRVYAGSDDGYVYCLDALDGSLIWSEQVGGEDMIWGNGQMSSVWPVRGSVLVDGSDIFWAAGLFPKEGMYVCKRNAADGNGGWTATPMLPPQGYLLATASKLFVPSGKTYPTIYNRTNGSYAGNVQVDTRDGGCWALLTRDESQFWTGPSVDNQVRQFSAQTGTYVAAVRGANYLIADDTYAYCCTDTHISKIQRNDCSILWSVDYAYPYALIKAGTTLFAGGNGEIAALRSTVRGKATQGDGMRIWTAPVKGKAYGLAVANGALYVSTDTGMIYCFSATVPL